MSLKQIIYSDISIKVVHYGGPYSLESLYMHILLWHILLAHSSMFLHNSHFFFQFKEFKGELERLCTEGIAWSEKVIVLWKTVHS